MNHIKHLTMQIGPFMIDVPLTKEGLDLAKDFLTVMGKFLEVQSRICSEPTTKVIK